MLDYHESKYPSQTFVCDELGNVPGEQRFRRGNNYKLDLTGALHLPKKQRSFHLDWRFLLLALAVAAVQNRPLPSITLHGAVHFIVLGVFCTAIYFVFQSVGQQYTKASKAAILLTTEAVFAALAGAVLYGERLPIRGYIGCVLIFCALLLTERRPKQKFTKNSS